jgi:hypothetical protein
MARQHFLYFFPLPQAQGSLRLRLVDDIVKINNREIGQVTPGCVNDAFSTAPALKGIAHAILFWNRYQGKALAPCFYARFPSNAALPPDNQSNVKYVIGFRKGQSRLADRLKPVICKAPGKADGEALISAAPA